MDLVRSINIKISGKIVQKQIQSLVQSAETEKTYAKVVAKSMQYILY